MDLSSIYSELIMEHNQSGHNKRMLDQADKTERGHNPSCGDDITIAVKLKDDVIEDAAFQGTGCAISQASTSMMIDIIRGKSKKEVLELVEIFIEMIQRKVSQEEAEKYLGDAAVLQNICNMPARVKCAVLGWHTLREALKE